MKDYTEFLNPREIYILENYPEKNLKVLGEELGISNVRVQKIKECAKRKIREQKRVEQEEDVAPFSFPRTLQRRDAWVLLRALEQYNACLQKEWRVDRNPETVKLEPDYLATLTLIEEFREALRQNRPSEKQD